MMELKYRAKPVEETVDLTQVVGKSVVSRDGEWIGKVESIHMDPVTFTLEGVTINRGFLNESEYVGREYVKSISRRGVVLQINPVTEAVGLPVYDVRGKRIGEVGTVERRKKTNRLSTIHVKRGWFKKSLIVPRNAIKTVNKGVMLNIPIKG